MTEVQPAMPREETSDLDLYENDPFFKWIPDAEWTACIGRQGYEENYLDGYIEAAIELVDAIIEKRMFAKRDTLVLPILYNARHAIELSLKFIFYRLIDKGLIPDRGRKRDHDIGGYWADLHASAIGDRTLMQAIEELKPYIDSLSQIDSDGQELRYHRNRDNDPSLQDYALANLRFIQHSLRRLEELLSSLKNRTVGLIDEHVTGSHTKRCSRSDLMEIARLMPQRDQWSSEEFDQQKAIVKERFGLGNRQFSLALDRIQEVREMRALIGIESELQHLTDDVVVWSVEQWRRLHPVREQDENHPGIDAFDPSIVDAWAEDAAVRKEVVEAIEGRLSREAVADLDAMFYLGRDRVFPEYYEEMIARNLRKLSTAAETQAAILHLMDKTNFLQCLQGAARKLGRLTLAGRLEAV